MSRGFYFRYILSVLIFQKRKMRENLNYTFFFKPLLILFNKCTLYQAVYSKNNCKTHYYYIIQGEYSINYHLG